MLAEGPAIPGCLSGIVFLASRQSIRCLVCISTRSLHVEARLHLCQKLCPSMLEFRPVLTSSETWVWPTGGLWSIFFCTGVLFVHNGLDSRLLGNIEVDVGLGGGRLCDKGPTRESRSLGINGCYARRSLDERLTVRRPARPLVGPTVVPCHF